MKRIAAALLLCLIATSAIAFYQSRDSNYNQNIVSGGGGSFSLTAGTNGGSGTTGTNTIPYTVTWGSGCNAVIFEISWYNTAGTDVVSSLSGAGAGATQVAGVASNGGSGQQSVDMWQLNSPGATGGTVTVNYSGNVGFNSNVTPYCLVSAHTTVSNTNHGTGGPCNAVTPISAAVTVPAGGAGIAMAANASGSVVSWTNATSDTGSPYTGGGTQDAWAKVNGTGSVTVTATPAGADNCTLGLASYGP